MRPLFSARPADSQLFFVGPGSFCPAEGAFYSCKGNFEFSSRRQVLFLQTLLQVTTFVNTPLPAKPVTDSTQAKPLTFSTCTEGVFYMEPLRGFLNSLQVAAGRLRFAHRPGQRFLRGACPKKWGYSGPRKGGCRAVSIRRPCLMRCSGQHFSRARPLVILKCKLAFVAPKAPGPNEKAIEAEL